MRKRRGAKNRALAGLWDTASSPLLAENLPSSGLAYLLAKAESEHPLLLVCADEARAAVLLEDLHAFGCIEAAYFPGELHIPFEEMAPDPERVAARLALRYRLKERRGPPVLITSIAALAGRWMPAAAFEHNTRSLRVGEEINRDALSQWLVRCGYQRIDAVVEDEGTFAVRGGLVDVFPASEPRPLRLDFFGDELTSIRPFDPETHRVFPEQDSLLFLPIRDVLFDDASVARAIGRLEALGEEQTIPSRALHATCEDIEARNYFFGVEALAPIFYESTDAIVDTLLGPWNPEEQTPVVVIDDRPAVEAALESLYTKAATERARALGQHRPVLDVSEHFVDAERLQHDVLAAARLSSATLVDDRDQVWDHGLSAVEDIAKATEARRSDPTAGEILDPIVHEMQRASQADEDFVIAIGSMGRAERLVEMLEARGVHLPWLSKGRTLRPTDDARLFGVCVAHASAGLRDPKSGFTLLTDHEIFGAPKRQRGRQRRPKTPSLTTLRDLQDGDHVIHLDHGIGLYLGLKRLVLGGVDGDYVHLEYAGGDKLYVPIYRINLLQRYRGDPKTARVDKLGGTRWERTKARVKDAVLALAHGLLGLQARRKAIRGFALPTPDEHFRAFEASFPHEETPDQQQAIDDVLGDLSQDTPMDRLVCGDVGYGKTEVAIRAAFLAALGGRQTAVLVPTTVLAEQHRMSFLERLAREGVRVEVLSRFRSTKETKEILREVEQGSVDILIGTHRILSPDVVFKNLGLLVVDEEQRFGVKHKERIKQLRTHVHVLTLSATPIPRTLHMASVGLRDLSLITTPPTERQAIRTEVTRFDESVVKEAIERELQRGGQVFVVHNRVQSIQAMGRDIGEWVPSARIGVAHGQMKPEQLEEIMVQFVRNELNVLVCTAIIENGIDIPTANTLIVNRADTFGLSQLYQLRGRIGRGSRRGYAYLLLPRTERITKDAAERLSILKRYSDLGAGFQIATHDLEIRGAGDLLGTDQAGQIAAVGFELYTELLSEAVEQARGEGARHVVEPDIKLPIAAVLPESYVPDPGHRLAYYQRMAQAAVDSEIFDVLGELGDRYGEPPEEVQYLAEVMVIRRRLRNLGVTEMRGGEVDNQVRISLYFDPSSGVDRADLVQRCAREPHRYRMTPKGQLVIGVPAETSDPGSFLRQIRVEIGQLKAESV